MAAVHDLNARQTKFQNIVQALIASGYVSLDEQAEALGLCRSTAWTIMKNKHKLARLSSKTIDRIITNPRTPQLVLTAVHEYLGSKSSIATEKKDSAMSDDVEVQQRSSAAFSKFVSPRKCGTAMELRWLRPGRHSSYNGKYICETCNRSVVCALVPDPVRVTADQVS